MLITATAPLCQSHVPHRHGTCIFQICCNVKRMSQATEYQVASGYQQDMHLACCNLQLIQMLEQIDYKQCLILYTIFLPPGPQYKYKVYGYQTTGYFKCGKTSHAETALLHLRTAAISPHLMSTQKCIRHLQAS